MSSVQLVPFTSREWLFIQEHYQTEDRPTLFRMANIIATWITRAGKDSPMVIQITDHLIHLKIQETETDYLSNHSLKCLINSYATAVIRVINYINEIGQTRIGNATIAKGCSIMDIPEWIVQIRHAAAHNLMPDVQLFRSAFHILRKWLFDKYWRKPMIEALCWAVPRYVAEREVKIQQVKDTRRLAFELLKKFCDWRYSTCDLMLKPSMVKDYPVLKEISDFVTKGQVYAETMASMFADMIMMMDDEKLAKSNLPVFELTGNVWEVPPQLQMHWGPLTTIFAMNHLLMELATELTYAMYNDQPTLRERKQLAGFLDLILEMMALEHTRTSAFKYTVSQWRGLIRTIMSNSLDFRIDRIKQVLTTTKIFTEKRINEMITLLRIKERDKSLGTKRKEPNGSTTDEEPPQKRKEGGSNVDYLMKDNVNISYSFINDDNVNEKFCVSSIDFSNVPLGLMPNDTCESLFLIMD